MVISGTYMDQKLEHNISCLEGRKGMVHEGIILLAVTDKAIMWGPKPVDCR